MNNQCVIDAREMEGVEKDFLTYRIWDAPTVFYPIEAALESELFSKVRVLVNSDKVRNLVEEFYKEKVEIVEDLMTENEGDTLCVIEGRAPMLTADMLKSAYEKYEGGVLVGAKKGYKEENFSILEKSVDKSGYAFYIQGSEEKVEVLSLPPKDALVLTTEAEFELALVLKGKKLGGRSVRVPLLKRISEKNKDFLNPDHDREAICLVGHSQLDFWEIKELAGRRVRNCGISGITAKEYDEILLQTGFLNCDSKVYVVMHGTNDIVETEDDNEIGLTIMKTIDYIKDHAVDPKIYFLGCTHVCGSALGERDNDRLSNLNRHLQEIFPEDVTWISLEEVDDEKGQMKGENTVDGLHFSEKGYDIVRKKLEERLDEDLR